MNSWFHLSGLDEFESFIRMIRLSSLTFDKIKDFFWNSHET